MASATIIKQKEADVAELSQKFAEAKAVVAFDYRGLTVSQMTELRSQLREAGCECKVYKNNIARRAAISAGFEDFSKDFAGPMCIAIGAEDVVAPAKIVYEFSKVNKALEIKTGLIEGEYSGIEGIMEIASLPSYEGLLTMLAGGMIAPLRDLSIGLHMYTEENAENAEA